MKLDPFAGWFAIVPVLVLAGSALVWQLYGRWRSKKAIAIAPLRRLLAVVMLVLIVLGVSVPGGSSSPGVANLDIVFAVDITASMGATDYAGGKLRLEGAKQDVAALAKALPGAHITIITFDSKATVLVPATTDPGAIDAGLLAMNREIAGSSNGSSIDAPLDLIVKQLKDAKTAQPSRQRLLYLMSDGEQTTDTPIKSFAAAAPLLNGGAVLGYGTASGAHMIKRTGLEAPGAKPDPANLITTPDASGTFVAATSKLDEAALKTIAEQLKITYSNRDKGGPVGSLVNESRAQLLIDKSKKVVRYINLYWLFAVPVVVVLFYEWQKVLVLLWQLKEKHPKDPGKHHA